MGLGRVQQRVKHLNPRQGITTLGERVRRKNTLTLLCETPKSPPGDYNSRQPAIWQGCRVRRVKHLNPRQGITTFGDS